MILIVNGWKIVLKKSFCIIGSKKMKKWHECKSYVRLNVGERVKNIE